MRYQQFYFTPLAKFKHVNTHRSVKR